MDKEIIDLLRNADIVLIGIGESFERRDSELETEEYRMFQKEN